MGEQVMAGNRAGSLTWLGHGTVVVRAGSTVLFVDPLLRDRLLFLRRYAPLRSDGFAGTTAVLVTHAHHDHLDVASIRRLGGETPVYAPRGADRVARRHGLGPVAQVAVGDALEIGELHVDVVAAAHSGSRLRAKPGDQAVGYVFAHGGTRTWVAGDTALFDEMSGIGPVDVAVLPVGGWWRTLGPGHLDPRDAVVAAERVGARTLIPIHWGTFHPRYLSRSMLASWVETTHALKRAIASIAPDIELRMLQPGETSDLAPGQPEDEGADR